MGMFLISLSDKIKITLTWVLQKPTATNQKNNVVIQPWLKYNFSQKKSVNNVT